MQAFTYVSPRTLDEAIAILGQEGEGAKLLSGGTDILVMLREGRRKAKVVVDVKNIPLLNELSFDPKTGLRIGAAVSCHRLYNDETVVRLYPGLIDSVSLIGGTAIQGRATLGGNVCTASPAGDSLPTLIALEAVVLLARGNIRRELPIEKLFAGPGKTVMEPNEMLTSIRIPPPHANSGAAYLRFIPRNEMDIAVASAGVSVVLDDTGAKFVKARISLGAVGPTPLLVSDAAQALVGREVSTEAIEAAAAMARMAAKPITDMRGSAEQRRHLSGVLTRRALEIAIERARKV